MRNHPIAQWMFTVLIIAAFISVGSISVLGQCSMCNAVASAQSEGAAKALNHGILLLLVPPVGIMSAILIWAFKYRNLPT
jgi:hypothetical protein